ncbi:phospholipase D family protein [Salipiger bermudensis]|uniref:phospholipase D family protein n=1 Tax=Salipiger bermudensis TaxID=344736 RepID=UPI001CD71C33|nr:phospholipase D family protein [Salipiger bermudensis]MCA1284777.1 phospholipase D family protein [Salipiger bermudensis]
MSDFLDGPKLLKRLRIELAKAQSADFAVAFWGAGAAESLGIEDGTDLRIVCNLMSGGTNPNEIRALLDRNASVRQLNDLHAKIGVVGDISFVGSSNMSANGLGAEERAANWREANVLYDGACCEIVAMFETFWEAATEIEEADLKAATRAWADRQRGNAVVAAGDGDNSLVDVLRTAPEILDALNVRMIVYDTNADADDAAILDNADKHARNIYGDRFEVYWDWPSIKSTAQKSYFVNYDWPSRGTIARAGIFRRNADDFPDFELDGETFHPVYEIDDIEGIRFEAEDKVAIRQAFHSYVRDGAKGEADGERTYNFPISELVRYLPETK